MQAQVIAVGSELLTPNKVDANSLYLARKLGESGIPLVRKSVVGDDRERLAAEIRLALEASELVILTGGLGPTSDDLTREAAADATGRALEIREAIVSEIEERFRRFGRPMAEVNRRQAYVLAGADILPNPRGTAPGQWLEHEGRILVLLPGPPRELEPLFAESCMPRLERLAPGRRFHTHTLRVAGIGESDVEQRIGPIYLASPDIETTILSAPGDIQIHLSASAEDERSARERAERLGSEIVAALGDAVYSRDGRTLDQTVAGLLRERGCKLAVAESCTGGLLAGRLTDLAGSSDFFAGGIVSYSEAAKRQWLGVDAGLLDRHGAVSPEIAGAMAEAARQHAAETLGEPAIGLSTTGYAGPEGGTRDSPVGTVYFGLADDGGASTARRQLGGARRRVRTLGVQTALDLLRRRLLGIDGS